MTWSIIQGNALALPLQDESVDLIITSPPYFALRSYRDDGSHYEGQLGSEPTPKDFLEALWAATAEMKRVLKPTGSMFVNLGDKYAGSGGHNNSNLAPDSHGTKVCPECGYEANRKRCNKCDTSMKWPKATTDPATRRNAPDRYNQDMGGVQAKSLMGLPWRYAIGCIDDLNLILRAEIVWSKPNGLPESVTDRVRRSHEQWFHFTKQGRYFAAMDEIREAHAPASLERCLYTVDDTTGGANRSRYDRSLTGKDDQRMVAPNPLGKLPGSVWTIPSEPLIIPEAIQRHYDLPDHFAAFPQEWTRRIILGWSPPNGVVLDPFSGTGTVVGVANALGRDGIGVELSNDYCRLARWRIENSGHFSKSVNRRNAELQGKLAV